MIHLEIESIKCLEVARSTKSRVNKYSVSPYRNPPVILVTPRPTRHPPQLVSAPFLFHWNFSFNINPRVSLFYTGLPESLPWKASFKCTLSTAVNPPPLSDRKPYHGDGPTRP